MRAIKYRELKQLHEVLGPEQTCRHIRENLESGALQPADFSFRELAGAMFGWEFVEHEMNPTKGRNDSVQRLMESDAAVSVTAFRNITGQIVYNAMIQKFQIATQVGNSLVQTVPTRVQAGEKMPGVTFDNDGIAKLDSEVHENEPYPRAGIYEDYVETPPIKKWGFIVPVSKEAVYYDRTGLVLQTAGDAAEYVGLKKEKLIIDMVGGCTSTFATGGKWKWKGTEYAPYNTTTVDWASYFYVNKITDVLTDHTDLDVALQLYGEMQDPNTREPIQHMPSLTLLSVPALMFTARKIANATEVRSGSGDETTIYNNPYGSTLNLIESRYLFRRLVDTSTAANAAAARKYWYLGDFKRAFAWMEAWDLTPSQAPVNAQAEFEQDVIAQFKASFSGAPAVIKPHYVIQSDGSA